MCNVCAHNETETSLSTCKSVGVVVYGKGVESVMEARMYVKGKQV